MEISRSQVLILLSIGFFYLYILFKFIINFIVYIKLLSPLYIFLFIILSFIFDFFSKRFHSIGSFSLSFPFFVFLFLRYGPIIAFIVFNISIFLRELFLYKEEKSGIYKFLSFIQDSIFFLIFTYLFYFFYPDFQPLKTLIKINDFRFFIFFVLLIISFYIIRWFFFHILFFNVIESIKREFSLVLLNNLLFVISMLMLAYLPYYSIFYKNFYFFLFSIIIIFTIYFYDYLVKYSSASESEVEVSNVLLKKFKEKDNLIEQLNNKLDKIIEERNNLSNLISTLWKYSKNIRQHINTKDLALDIIAVLKDSLKLDTCIIFIFNEQKKKYIPLEYISNYLNFNDIEILQIDINRVNIVSRAISQRTSLLIDAYTPVKLPLLFPKEQSIICVPILGNDYPIGAIYLGYRDFQYYSKLDLQLVQLIAYIAGPNFIYAQLYKKARNLAITDGLTGLYTHRYMHEVLQKEVKKAKPLLQSLSIIMIDTDHFKQFNDTYGHPKGDELLVNLADIFRQETTSKDIICRYGGDEFTIILVGKGKTKAYEIGEKIRLRVYNELNTKEMHFKISTSIGIASFPEDAISKEELLKKADLALYYSKEHGRNQVTVYSEKLSK